MDMGYFNRLIKIYESHVCQPLGLELSSQAHTWNSSYGMEQIGDASQDDDANDHTASDHSYTDGLMVKVSVVLREFIDQLSPLDHEEHFAQLELLVGRILSSSQPGFCLQANRAT